MTGGVVGRALVARQARELRDAYGPLLTPAARVAVPPPGLLDALERARERATHPESSRRSDQLSLLDR